MGLGRKINEAERALARRSRRTRLRMCGVIGGLALGFIGVVARAIDLHLGEQRSLKWIATKQYRAVIPTAPRRGKIFDTKGRELAVDIPVFSIYADPRAVRDRAGTLAALDRLLGLGGETPGILRQMERERKFVWIKRRVAREVAEHVRALKLPGISSVEESKRFYPNGALASQVLGAVGYDAQPLGGVELAYHGYLASGRGEAVYQRDARGRFFYTPVHFPTVTATADVDLTIDKVIQHYTETILQTAVTTAQARHGVAVVVDVASGRVLAMATMPTFDPNDYTRYDQALWRNRAITDPVEPGSTFKVLIAAGAIEAGMDPERTFDCERGAIKIGAAVLHDHDPYGTLALKDIIRVSSNIGALKVAQALGREPVARTLQAFRIGQPTGIDFPGEGGGILRDAATWQPVELATIAFGQGVTATPLQMTMAFAAIANGGTLFRPYLVERIRRSDGTLLYEGGPKAVGQPVRSATAAILTAMLERVVEAGGTGTKAASPIYRIAGKTGTAQKVVEGTGHYAAGKYFASFIGFAPVPNPRIAVFVGIDEPHGSYFGGIVAAPAFRAIVETTLQYFGVPSQKASVIVARREPMPSRPLWMAMRRPPRPPRGDAVGAKTLPADLPADVAFLPVGTTELAVPNVYGLPIRHVARLAGVAGVRLRVEGTGVAVAQEPAAGGVIARGGLLAVRFAMPE